MSKILNKKSWLGIILVLIIVSLGFFIFLSFIRGDRILDKYSGHKDFVIVRETMKANLDFINKNPNNDSAYYSLAQGFFGMQGYDDAVWALQEAIRIEPSTYYYWSFLGKTYQAKKDYPPARDAYIKTLELEPNQPVNYTQLAWLYYFRLDAEKDKAFDVLKKGLEKFPADNGVLFDITRYYMYDENKEEFLKYAPKYIKIDSNNEAINNKYKEWK